MRASSTRGPAPPASGIRASRSSFAGRSETTKRGAPRDLAGIYVGKRYRPPLLVAAVALLAEFRGFCHDRCAGYTLYPASSSSRTRDKWPTGRTSRARAATVEDDALLVCAIQQAAAYARAFVGAVKDMLTTNEVGS